MNLAFTLSMPHNNSWNGRWSGAGNLYVVVKALGSAKKTRAKYAPLVGRAFYYNFGDGWGATVSVREVIGREVTELRKKSKGFCGYEWMVQEILQHGRILALGGAVSTLHRKLQARLLRQEQTAKDYKRVYTVPLLKAENARLREVAKGLAEALSNMTRYMTEVHSVTEEGRMSEAREAWPTEWRMIDQSNAALDLAMKEGL